VRTLLITLALLGAAGSGWCVTCSDRPAAELKVSDECRQELRRTEIRKLAIARLAAVSSAIAEVATKPGKIDGVIAVARAGRPAAWCEALLNDVLAQRNVEVVDDENAPGPRWITSVDKNGRRSLQAGPILDPGFKEWRVRDDVIVQGYVTLRWRGENLVALRVVAGCDEGDAAAARCDKQRHPAAHVHDADVPFACTATFVERPHWNNWKEALVPIRLELPPAQR
jgi:hypothetical protein